MTKVDPAWLPIGEHYGLKISHRISKNPALTWTPGKPKFCLHTTENKLTADPVGIAMYLEQKKFDVHLILNLTTGKLIQCLPLTGGGYGLEHPSGTPATNTAHVIQMEIVGTAAGAVNWTDEYLKHIGAVTALLDHRIHMGLHVPLRFRGYSSQKIDAKDFASTQGIIGHCHVPNNNHGDPGNVDMVKVQEYARGYH